MAARHVCVEHLGTCSHCAHTCGEFREWKAVWAISVTLRRWSSDWASQWIVPYVYKSSLIQDCSGSAHSPESPSENEGSASSSVQVLSGHQILTVIF